MDQHSGDNDGEMDGSTDDPPDSGCQYLYNLRNTILGNQNSYGNNEEEKEEEMDLDLNLTFQPVEDSQDTSEAAWSSYIDQLSNLAKLNSMKTTMAFIQALKTVSFDDKWSKLDADALNQLQNPPMTLVNINDNLAWHLGLDLYLSVTNSAQETYTSVRKAILWRYSNDEVPSYDQIKHYVAKLSGVYFIEDDMCINSCLVFTCSYKDLQTCSKCYEPRFDLLSKKPCQQLHTIPLGPQLQAL
jgi:CRISPR/Cas system CMR-associated protein Cmr5 small subunit